MHPQANPLPRPDDPRVLTQAALSLLVATEPRLWTIDELARELQDADGAASGTENRHQIHTAVDTLRAAGLVHTHNRFVFASRAAVEAAVLTG